MSRLIFFFFFFFFFFFHALGWSGGAKGVVYLTSPGRQTDIGLQLVEACYPVAGKGRGGCFISSVSSLSLLFLFDPCPSLLSIYLLSLLFSPFLRKTSQKDPQGLTVVKPQHNQIFHA